MTDGVRNVEANWEPLRGAVPEPVGRGHGKECESCGHWQFASRGYELTGLRGWFCSIFCVEQALFSGGKCRWCGAQLNGRCDAKFCSSACREKSKAVEFGSGTRLLRWLHSNRPETWRAMIRAPEPAREKLTLWFDRPQVQIRNIQLGPLSISYEIVSERAR